MAPIVPEVLGLGFFANLGDTHHFFQPWLNDRNGRGSVFYPSFLSRIFGRRKKRSSGFNGMDIISPQGIYLLQLIFSDQTTKSTFQFFYAEHYIKLNFFL